MRDGLQRNVEAVDATFLSTTAINEFQHSGEDKAQKVHVKLVTSMFLIASGVDQTTTSIDQLTNEIPKCNFFVEDTCITHITRTHTS